ncbi:hypothetical protein R6Q59_022437 [Mikania micrantha]
MREARNHHVHVPPISSVEKKKTGASYSFRAHSYILYTGFVGASRFNVRSKGCVYDSTSIQHPLLQTNVP